MLIAQRSALNERSRRPFSKKSGTARPPRGILLLDRTKRTRIAAEGTFALKGLKSGTAARQLGAIFQLGVVQHLTDGRLLERFNDPEDPAAEAAFEALVDRHGPLVLKTCRSVLGDAHAAEDAFQATFLVLARKARALQVRDSVAPWLQGVARRVATRARSAAWRRQKLEARFADRNAARATFFEPNDQGQGNELGPIVRQEIARLPERYRAVVELCDLQGRSHEEAARDLGWPIGTVKSRQARGRSRLRDRLARRGLDPSASSVWVGTVSQSLIQATTQAAIGFSAGSTATKGVIPVAAAALASLTLRSMIMFKLRMATMALLATGSIGIGAAGFARQDGQAPDQATKPQPPGELKADAQPNPLADSAPQGKARPTTPSPWQQYRELRDDWDRRVQAFLWNSSKQIHTIQEMSSVEKREYIQKKLPDHIEYTRRFLELAEAHPEEPGAIEALLWTLDWGLYKDVQTTPNDLMDRVVNHLLEHYADHWKLARYCLAENQGTYFARERLIQGLLDRSKDRESVGMACLALALSLDIKADCAQRIAETTPPIKLASFSPLRHDPDYKAHLRTCDPQALRQAAEDLYERVVAEFSEIPYNPGTNTLAGLIYAAQDRTLGDVARERLDKRSTLALGRPAPEIEGEDLDGQPLKLDDYRGQIVVLHFWTTLSREYPDTISPLRTLADRLEGRPVSILGVNRCNGNRDWARKVLADRGVTWPNWHDEAFVPIPFVPLDRGPIFRRYHVQDSPIYFILDTDGVIRHKTSAGDSIVKVVDQLLKEIEE